MPVFDRDPLPTASEREAARQAREKQEARKKEVKKFYAAIKQGSITPFVRDSKESKEPGIPVSLSFSRDQKHIAPFKTSFDSQVPKAKTAIRNHDIRTLKAILGPELFLSRQQFLTQSRKVQQNWLVDKCRLEFINDLGLFISYHVTANSLPDVLSTAQHKYFITELKWIKQKDTMDRLTARAKGWNLSNQSHAASVLSIFEKIIDEETSPLYKTRLNISEVLYGLNETKEKLQKKCETRQLQQQELNKNFVDQSSAEHVSQKWLAFQKELEKGLTGAALIKIREEIQNSRENPFAELGLANGAFYQNNKQESVFDYAAELYAKAASERDKKKLLSCIEVLLIHGDRPSSALDPDIPIEKDEDKAIEMDWSLLSLVLTHLSPETNFSRNVRTELLSYCEKSQKTLDSWFGQIFLNPVIKETRRKDVQNLIVLLCTLNASKIDQVLAAKIKQKSVVVLEKQKSNLYTGMRQIMQKTENGALVLAIAAGKDLPMQPMSSAQGLIAPRRNSVFHQSSSIIKEPEKDVEVEKAEIKGKGFSYSSIDEVD